MRSGPGADWHEAGDDEQTRVYVQALYELSRGEHAANAALVPHPHPRRLLDIGGAHGAFAMAMCDRHPGLQATVLDLPASARVGRGIIAGEGYDGRITVQAGDALVDDLGTDLDVVSAFNVVQHLAPEDVRRLLGRAADALAPGGCVVIGETLRPDPSRAPVAQGALTSLLFYLMTGTAHLRPQGVGELDVQRGPHRAFPPQSGLTVACRRDRHAGLRHLEVAKRLVESGGYQLNPSCPVHVLLEGRWMTSTGSQVDVADLVDGAEGPPGLHHLIEAQAARRPDAVAVVSGLTRLTYGELDRQANQLARHLRTLGAGPETVVAIAAHRRAETVVGLLGILKSGSAYLPVDPGQPAERVAFMLDDAGAGAVVAATGHPSPLTATGRPVVTLESAAPWRGGDDSPVSTAAHPAQLAYVIYTSGSTGAPKGVLVEHRHIVASTRARDAFGRRSPDVFLLVVPLSFDAAGQGLYWTLSRGGTLVIAHDRQVPDARSLSDLIRTEAVTHTNFVPSLYGVLLDAGGSDLATLRDVSVGGEVAAPDLVARHRRALPGCDLYNDYGPTEATIWATAHRCDDADAAPGATVPIGRPVRATAIRLLDGALDPVPDGEVGEICIGGAHVARGYRGSPALTAARFVPDPTGGPGERLYRTGDAGRRRPDGLYEFVGRHDHQVKLRGHRIELGEVDAGLRRLAGITDAAAVTPGTASGELELVACIVPAGSAGAPSPATLRRQLVRWLPASMIPTRFVVLDALPRTTHGKVDRPELTRLARLARLARDRAKESHGR